MDSDHPDTSPPIVLVGGPPRSGTSHFMRLLDSAPELLVFPYEPRLLERAFQEDEVPDQPWKGKELAFIDSQRLINLSRLLESQGIMPSSEERAFIESIDPERFDHALRAFLNQHAGETFSLETAVAVGRCLVAASDTLLESYKCRPETGFVFKMPFYADALAQKCLTASDSNRFIALHRDPVARYASAKARRLKISGEVAPVANRDYTSFQADLDIATRHIDLAMADAYGDRVLLLGYEDLASYRDATMSRVAAFLDIAFGPHLLEETKLGFGANTPSSFGARITSHTDAMRIYADLMSPAEQNYVRLRVAAASAPLAERKPLFRQMKESGGEPFMHERTKSLRLRRRELRMLTYASFNATCVANDFLRLCRVARPPLI